MKTIYEKDLAKIKSDLYTAIKKSTDRPVNRICAVWAFCGSQILNKITNSNDYKMVLGNFKIAVNQTNSNDMSEGWYWGYDCDLPDSMESEYHAWIYNSKKNTFIDFTSSFYRENFENSLLECPLPNDYKWHRLVPVPGILHLRNYSQKKLLNEFGIECTEGKREIDFEPDFSTLNCLILDTYFKAMNLS